VKSLLIVAYCVVAAAAPEEPARELSTQAVPSYRSQSPYFRHGYLILSPPGGPNGSSAAAIFFAFYPYGPDGKLAYDGTIEVPGGIQPVVRDVDFDGEGSAVVAVSATGGAAGFLHGVLLLDRAGRQTRFINTGFYTPAHITLASDHSIWTLGLQMDPSHPPFPVRTDYMIVRHMAPDGTELGAYLPRSLFPTGIEPGISGAGPQIAVTGDRVGILAYSGKTSAHSEWVELDLNGNVLLRSRTDDLTSRVDLVAFTADDHVYLSGNRGEFYTLDHSSNQWVPVPRQGDVLLGVDGTRLVYRQRETRPIQLQWFDQP
jgi:hypothetical protein